MEIKQLKKRSDLQQVGKWMKRYYEFERLLDVLRNKEIPSDIMSSINQDIENLNSFSGSDRALLKTLKSTEFRILKLVEKELKLVPKNVYRNRWMAIGMSAFGIPFGLAFGIGVGNMAFLAIGIPIGLSIGIAIGAGMDKKAFEEGRQLEIEIKP